jgi:hypothetical protein
MRESTYILDLSMDGLDPNTFTWVGDHTLTESIKF